MAHSRAVVWIQPHEAKLFAFDADKVERKRIPADDARAHAARDSGNVRDEHLRDDRQFFEAVLAAVEGDLDDSGRWVIVGSDKPASEFGKYVHDHAEALQAKLVGVERSSDLSEQKILDLARRRLGAAARVDQGRA
ncbi:hypothetical protein SAMN02745126_02663 [Enhydrobacter aerosaccus]|uniref:Protein required for attachment to host cells n=1 Tax=Enhydrobacter aerosaccus TaxID=225324 RepID=A0A1T4P7Z5_9HYPH|nr:hypothetical protein [Enhydrobacter aerosaccus]SJZ87582.1 hypothetical protein SAMN02745126_02663 [Enhydrobacter aerosaccus]